MERVVCAQLVLMSAAKLHDSSNIKFGFPSPLVQLESSIMGLYFYLIMAIVHLWQHCNKELGLYNHR